MTTLLILNHDGMGHGDAELGRRLIKTFLQKAQRLRDLDAIALYNAGVKLVSEDSEVLGELVHLEEDGVDLIPCGTCCEKHGVTPAVGKVQGMDDIVGAMDAAARVITL